MGPVGSVPGMRQPHPLMIELYPNPATGFSTLAYELSEPSMVTLKIYDMNGRMVQEPLLEWQPEGQQHVVIDGRKLASGLYICVLQTSKNTGLRKLIKN